MIKNIKQNRRKFVIVAAIIVLAFVYIAAELIKQRAKVTDKEASGIATLKINSSQTDVFGLIDEEVGYADDFFQLPVELTLELGQYTLQFFKEGYRSKTVNVNFQSDQTINIELEREIVIGDLYRIPVESGAVALGWNENRIYYQTENRLREARTNSVLTFFPTESAASISQNGSAATQSNQTVQLVIRPPKIKELKIAAENVELSPDGQKFATLHNNVVTVYSIGTRRLSSFEFNESVSQLAWHNNHQLGCVVKTNASQDSIYTLDAISSDKEKVLSPQKEVVRFSFSPKGNYLVVSYKSGTTIYNRHGEIVKELPAENIFGEKSFEQSLGVWRNDSQLILVEKYQERFAVDLFRTEDKVWLINPLSGDKSFITSSAPIPNKIDFNVTPKPSPDKNAIIFAETDGYIWLLLLNGQIQNYMPNYQSPPSPRLPYSAP